MSGSPPEVSLMKQLLARLTSRRRRHRVLPPLIRHRVVLSEASIRGLRDCLAPETRQRHEGIAYLYGLTDGATTVVVGAARPQARTTRSSFAVSSVAMAEVLRAVDTAGLQLVGQAHSHPEVAYHSDGDDDGARIAYQGFVSIVLPRYAIELPSLAGSAAYFFHDQRFVELDLEAVTIVPERLL
jgi:hypothetical protein